MERQFLVAQLAILLEQSTTQDRLGRQALPSGGLDGAAAQITRDQAEQVSMLVEPLRHRVQFAADLVPGKTIE